MSIFNRLSLLQVCLLALISLSITTFAEYSEATLVTPVKIDNVDFYERFTAIGQVKSANSRSYHAKTDGTIDFISITQGKNVTKGEALITIDSEIAKATKAKAEAEFISAKITYDRDLSLFDKKIISSEAINKSKLALEIARSELVNAINKYEDMVITAPFDGAVGVVRGQVGDDVKAGDYLFSLVAHGDQTIFIELPEILHGKIDQNSTVFVVDSAGEKIIGKMIAVSDYLNDNGTITTKLSFPPSAKIMHGSFVETEIVFDKHKALGIPEKAVLKNNQGNFIYKITEDNKAKQIYVRTGSRTGEMIEIISDEINAGDQIIQDGLTKVHDDALVKIIDDSVESKQQE